MARVQKQYIITEVKGTYISRTYKTEALTLVEAIEYYSYTLECGASWSHEKGNKKINRTPKTITSLISNLQNATDNSAKNGCGSGFSYAEA